MFYYRYAVWFGGSLLASLVCLIDYECEFARLTHLLSPSSTPTATRRRNTKKLVPVFADVTRFSAASIKEAQSKTLYRINGMNMDVLNLHSINRSMTCLGLRKKTSKIERSRPTLRPSVSPGSYIFRIFTINGLLNQSLSLTTDSC